MAVEGLSVVCAGLGSIEEDEDDNRVGYSPGEYCLDNLKDLLRFLRRDDPESREVFQQVCKWSIVGKHLIPIIEHHQDNRNLVLNAVKVLVFLTMPVELSSKDIPQQIEYLWQLKACITNSDIVAVIVSLLESPLENLESDAFTEDDWKLVQLVLTLFRNILAIQDISLQQKLGSASEYLTLRDNFLELLFKENVMDLIVVLTQHVDGSYGYIRQDNLLLLEIFHYILSGQDPELIATAYVKKGSKNDGAAETSVNGLLSIIEDEAEKRKIARQRKLNCYTQFTGTFTKVTLDGSKTLLKGNPCSASHDTLLNSQTKHRGRSKRMAWDQEKLPSTKNSILESLHDFVNQLLSGGYNVLMQSVRTDIEKEHDSIQSTDVVVFFQVARFVASFQYQKFLSLESNTEDKTHEDSSNNHADNTLFEGSICGPIAETMNESMFLLVISKWRSAFEGLKETNDFKFLSAAGSLTKIMIRMLDLILKKSSEDSREPQTARILLYKLFYDQTDQGMTHFLLNLFKSFDRHKQPKSDLADLLETIHVIIRLMENLQARGTLRVSKKSRKKKIKKASNEKKDSVNEDSNTYTLEKDASDNPTAEKNIVVETIIPDEADESEILKLKEMENKRSDDVNNGFGTDDSSSDDQEIRTNEVDLKVSAVVSAVANTTIIQNLCWLIKFYKSNSISTNHYIICMMRRICEDLELSPMFYQLSLLTTFHEILREQKSSPSKEYANIVHFLSSLVRRMMRKMKSNPLLFVEVLFWKTRRECHYINCETMIKDLKKESKKWGSENQDGDFGPSQNNEWRRRNIADALGDDEVDFVIPRSIDEQNDGMSVEHESERASKRTKHAFLNEDSEEKIKDLYEKYKENWNCSILIAEELEGKFSAAQVLRKLKQLGLAIPRKRKLTKASGSTQPSEENASHSKSLNSRKRVRAFSEEQDMMIRNLYEQFKENKRCSFMIANSLDADGKFTAAQISRKLKQLGLIVPRQKKSGINLNLRDEDSTDLSDDEPLSSLRSRQEKSESKLNLKDEDPDISDDEPLSSLQVPRQKRSETKSILRDEDPTDASDDEPLSSLHVPRQKRSGTKSNLRDEGHTDISDDEPLSSLCVPRHKISETKSNLGDEDPTATSDDEPLSSLRVSRQKTSDTNLDLRDGDPAEISDDEPLSSLRDPHKKTSETNLNLRDEDPTDTSDDEPISSFKQRSKRKQIDNETEEGPSYADDELLSSVLKNNSQNAPNDGAANDRQDSLSEDGDGESEESRPHESVAITDMDDNTPQPDDDLADELADFADDEKPLESLSPLKATVSRRKLRMVIDAEDD